MMSLQNLPFSGKGLINNLLKFLDYVFLFCSFPLFYAISIILISGFISDENREILDFSVLIVGIGIYLSAWYLKRYRLRKEEFKKIRPKLEQRITRLIETSLYLSYAISLSLFIHALLFPAFNKELILSTEPVFSMFAGLYLDILLVFVFVLTALVIFITSLIISAYLLLGIFRILKPKLRQDSAFEWKVGWVAALMSLIVVLIPYGLTGGYFPINGLDIPQLWTMTDPPASHVEFIFPETFYVEEFAQRLVFFTVGPLSIYLIRMLFFRKALNMDRLG